MSDPTLKNQNWLKNLMQEPISDKGVVDFATLPPDSNSTNEDVDANFEATKSEQPDTKPSKPRQRGKKTGKGKNEPLSDADAVKQVRQARQMLKSGLRITVNARPEKNVLLERDSKGRFVKSTGSVALPLAVSKKSEFSVVSEVLGPFMLLSTLVTTLAIGADIVLDNYRQYEMEKRRQRQEEEAKHKNEDVTEIPSDLDQSTVPFSDITVSPTYKAPEGAQSANVSKTSQFYEPDYLLKKLDDPSWMEMWKKACIYANAYRFLRFAYVADRLATAKSQHLKKLITLYNQPLVNPKATGKSKLAPAAVGSTSTSTSSTQSAPVLIASPKSTVRVQRIETAEQTIVNIEQREVPNREQGFAYSHPSILEIINEVLKRSEARDEVSDTKITRKHVEKIVDLLEDNFKNFVPRVDRYELPEPPEKNTESAAGEDSKPDLDTIHYRALMKCMVDCLNDGHVYQNPDSKEFNEKIRLLTKTAQDISEQHAMRDVWHRMMEYLLMFIKAPTQGASVAAAIVGPAGLGKTTLADKLGEYLKVTGMAINGTQVRSRESFVTEFMGQATNRTLKTLYEALNSTLAIDEVYTIAERKGNGARDEEGKTAITTLMLFMSENAGLFHVLVMGYKDRVEKDFFDVNPGIKSRVPALFELKHYTPREFFNALTKKLREEVEDGYKFTRKGAKAMLRVFTYYADLFPAYMRNVMEFARVISRQFLEVQAPEHHVLGLFNVWQSLSNYVDQLQPRKLTSAKLWIRPEKESIEEAAAKREDMSSYGDMLIGEDANVLDDLLAEDLTEEQKSQVFGTAYKSTLKVAMRMEMSGQGVVRQPMMEGEAEEEEEKRENE